MIFVTCNRIPSRSFVLKMAIRLWNLYSQGHNHITSKRLNYAFLTMMTSEFEDEKTFSLKQVTFAFLAKKKITASSDFF